eukprot:Cvel_34217.t1-p1 / transcript=Cvel_34217.t1 / gene=Cvel_34217 / organism=Chromera_velia_CCMP2878 / gene_product=hypothetical protein / transcript_product=hypothetical protein / location=Cvel_scaffold5800:1904-2641(+) / protein_length=82 / sequence_SO=supercontig / SO=protein_coding / is_pseudo=false
MAAGRVGVGTRRGGFLPFRQMWGLLLLCLACLQRTAAWVLVGKDGTLTFIGTLDIDPSHVANARIDLRASGIRRWNLYVEEQ